MSRRGMVRRRRVVERSLLCATLATCGAACRFVAYLGDSPVSGAELLVEPEHSLLDMAIKPARCPGVRGSPRYNATQFALRNNDLNTDGFGIAWYEPGSAFARRVRAADPIAVVRSSSSSTTRRSPPRDESLVSRSEEEYDRHELLDALVAEGDATRPYMASNMTCVSDVAPRTSALTSRVVFAHARAASAGGLNTLNSHPFVYNTLTWMHNGGIAGFKPEDGDVKGLMESRLDASALNLIAGETDSEYAGAAFIHELKHFPQFPHYPIHAMRSAMRRAIRHIVELSAERTEDASSLNFAVTDGVSLIAARYRSDKNEDPPSLYYKLLPETQGILLASEPLDFDLTGWTLLGKDRLLSFNPDDGLFVECVDLVDSVACDADLAL